MLNKDKFIRRCAKKHGFTISSTKEYVDAIFEDILELVEEGETLKLSGFGKFDLYRKKERTGIINGVEWTKGVRQSPRFEFSRGFKERIESESDSNNQ